jgi:hypothetical protein
MPASKALLFVIVLGTIVATFVFALFEDLRPPFVERMFLQAQGFGPATSPSDALDKFKSAIRKRNFKAAATLCGGEYAEELRRAAKKATTLAKSVDDLIHNVEEVANINSPRGRFMVRLLEPFPRDFKVIDIKPDKKNPDELATAVILLYDDSPQKAMNREDVSDMQNYLRSCDARILYSLVPLPLGMIQLPVVVKYEGTAKKSWKIYVPEQLVNAAFREKVQYLRDNGGNYVRAMDNVKYSIKHEAATKMEFEGELRKQLSEAK